MCILVVFFWTVIRILNLEMSLFLRQYFAWHRFQGQSGVNDCAPCDFQMAIEEAFLAEQGFTEKLIADINMAAGNATYDESILRGVQEATGSNQDQASCLEYRAF